MILGWTYSKIRFLLGELGRGFLYNLGPFWFKNNSPIMQKKLVITVRLIGENGEGSLAKR